MSAPTLGVSAPSSATTRRHATLIGFSAVLMWALLALLLFVAGLAANGLFRRPSGAPR